MNSVNLLKIEGNVNHGVASYGNNNISLTADKILIHTDVAGKVNNAISFNGLIVGSGKVNLASLQGDLNLLGFSKSDEIGIY